MKDPIIRQIVIDTMKAHMGADWEPEPLPLEIDGQPVQHVLPISGGADSTCLSLLMMTLYPDVNFKCVFADTGAEFESLYKRLDMLEGLFDQEIIRVKAKEDLFEHIMSGKKSEHRGGFLPGKTSRWCTPYLKINPINKYYEQNFNNSGGKTFQYVGLRADEDRLGSIGGEESGIVTKYPFVKWNMGRREVYSLLALTIGIDSSYKFKSRSSCYCCPFQRNAELVGLLINEPSSFDHAAKFEKISPEEQADFDQACTNWGILQNSSGKSIHPSNLMQDKYLHPNRFGERLFRKDLESGVERDGQMKIEFAVIDDDFGTVKLRNSDTVLMSDEDRATLEEVFADSEEQKVYEYVNPNLHKVKPITFEKTAAKREIRRLKKEKEKVSKQVAKAEEMPVMDLFGGFDEVEDDLVGEIDKKIDALLPVAEGPVGKERVFIATFHLFHPYLGQLDSKPKFETPYLSEYATYSTTMAGLKRSCLFYAEHKLNTSYVYGLTEAEMLERMRVSIHTFELKTGILRRPKKYKGSYYWGDMSYQDIKYNTELNLRIMSVFAAKEWVEKMQEAYDQVLDRFEKADWGEDAVFMSQQSWEYEELQRAKVTFESRKKNNEHILENVEYLPNATTAYDILNREGTENAIMRAIMSKKKIKGDTDQSNNTCFTCSL
ncbi:phosphoadenosine phosphosulfate reductase domain-containing protein [Photobacterium leiognathi]|uniref:phosphoadenosine phosphosulfate reductase domain-containing protein n=1 Tax=Photobacterium leiognathi TaxID=553611 RepID=UPI002981467F|nr:phosphoadenosine phosphosulfate reductase family protein [Photobacterium leiognathi]